MSKALMNVPVVDSLTPAAIQTMCRMKSSDDDLFFVPTVQVYRIKRNICDGGENWSIALSDGQYYVYGLCDDALINLIHNHDIAQNAIVRVYKFQVTIRNYRGRDMKVVRLIDADKAAPNPGYPIGTPINIQGDRNETETSPAVDLSVAVTAGENDGPNAVASREAFFSTSKMKGRWQHDYRDFHHRRDMVKTLIKMLSTDAPQETLDTIPTRAKQIELVLYQQAPTFDDYIDMTTLKDRIKRLQECNEAGETGIIRKRGENRGL
ncbi:hypothetical protein QTG54_005445 [Skeletonema marinoi]|uniref:Replication factor-A protein 1 N-terminal domain-containing protein n=1 Tax=Skeletonema marinoi TaxID=267567 RepID=A0AAD9DFM6_9STRA|nr:hypothetical protein QTG54_005445 [Skeletonema marinoi]